MARAAVVRQAGRTDKARVLAQAALAELPEPSTRCAALLELYELDVNKGDLDEAGRWLAQARAYVAAGVTDLKLTVYPEAKHDSWKQAYADPKFYEWLLKQSR